MREYRTSTQRSFNGALCITYTHLLARELLAREHLLARHGSPGGPVPVDELCGDGSVAAVSGSRRCQKGMDEDDGNALTKIPACFAAGQ